MPSHLEKDTNIGSLSIIAEVLLQYINVTSISNNSPFENKTATIQDANRPPVKRCVIKDPGL